MSIYKLLAFVLLVYSPVSWTQCAPGIPAAGNPGCIPPNAPGSPYDQSSDPEFIAPMPARAATWEDRWGAIAIDSNNGAAGGANKAVTKGDATRVAVERCMHSGGIHCEIAVSFVNQCAAIAQKSGRGLLYPATSANTEADEAAKRAITKCGGSAKCKIVSSLCSYAVRAQQR